MSLRRRPTPQRLVVDYRLHYARAGGKSAAKVFKLRTFDLAVGETVPLSIRQTIKDFSTRRHHPGTHEVELIVNGQTMARACVRAAGRLKRIMAKKKYLLTATLPDGYVKTIGPTATEFTHYWRLVAHLGNGKTEVFWGHTKSLAEAKEETDRRRRGRCQSRLGGL